jgi:hypothetical protein
VPVTVAPAVVSEALLVNDAIAEAPPLARGVNVTVKVTDWLVLTVSGNETPLIENSAGFVPPMLTEDTTTLAPVALRVPLLVPLVPTVTLPTLTALTLNWLVCPVADPLNDTVRFGFDALEEIATLPL